MADQVGEIRQRVDIVNLIEESGTKLKKTGKNFVGLCPFHPDKSPSMSVNPMLGRYKCFSCGAAGDVFTWVMNTQGLDFKDALRSLAERAGIKLSSKGTGVDKQAKDLAQLQIEMMEMAARFYATELEKDAKVLEYCEKRNLDESTRKKWKLGLSPDFELSLTSALQRNGLSLGTAADLYLTNGNESSGFRDRFNNRLMFPIRNEKGDTVAFGGRILGAGQPKYLNSSDTPLFSKSSTLYGLFESRQTLAKSRHLLLTEGYMDVIACHRAGFEFAVASLGTSLTESQAKIMKRWADRVTIVYDGDSAGRKAAIRASTILEETDLNVRVGILPEGEDPDTICSNLGRDAFDSILKSAKTPIEFALYSLESEMSPKEEEFWTQAVEIISSARSEIVLVRCIDGLAAKYPGVQDIIAARRALRADVESKRKERRIKSKKISRSIDQEETSENFSAGNKGMAAKQRPPLVVSEVALFFMYLEDFHREQLHQFITCENCLITETAKECAEELLTAFSNSPPSGPPSDWIHSAPILADCFMGLNPERFGQPSEEYLMDSIMKLRRRSKETQARETLGEPITRLEAIQNTLSQSKSDPRSAEYS